MVQNDTRSVETLLLQILNLEIFLDSHVVMCGTILSCDTGQ